MSRQKGDTTLYTIKVTGEQIKTIRSLYLRVEQTWIRSHATEYLTDDDIVERTMLYECYYCRHGSHESAASIAHEKTCIVPLAAKEFDGLNAQFMEVQP